MKEIKIGSVLINIGIVFYVLENFYFGWNKNPMSDMELYADNVVLFLVYVGVGFYASPLIEIYKDAIKNNESKNQ